MSAFDRALAGFRVPPAGEVQAEADARAERLLAPLDALARDFAAALGRMHAQGPFPDRRRTPRAAAPATAQETTP